MQPWDSSVRKLDSLTMDHEKVVASKTEAVAGRSVDNIYGKTGAVQLVRAGSDKKACDYDTLAEDQEYIKEIKELHAYLDTVKTMVRPGCSPEVMKIAMNSMSTLFNTLTFVSSVTRPRASL
ncbi:hypothetical protein DKX38_008922 [Salix brachista]|uniref:Uncharacterized protein n=1 Tax=Salix brachista TaxID=2182728 RepID=A0A5N5MBK4_9ROSI|nr:hypothetical protein DKX38_008922 [Salix brachista]